MTFRVLSSPSPLATMRGRSRTLCLVSPPLYLFSFLFLEIVAAEVVPYLKPGFSFEYESSQIPITEQCDTVKLRWSRGNAQGPPPVAPYSFQVFSSTMSTPLVVPAGHGPTFDWVMPFPPDTQYQICMYDSFGISGGCQGMRTVIPPLSSNATCPNATTPEALAVKLGPLTRPGVTPQTLQAEQCSDLTVQPQSGSPPFTLTVSPSMHPPVNITSTNRNPIDWTIALPEGFPFFLSLASSDGLSWSQGPFYVLPSGSTSCLSGSTIPQSTLAYSAAGSGAGGLAVGLIVGAVGTWFFLRRRGKLRRHPKRDSSPPSKPEVVHDVISPGLPIQMPPRQSTVPMSYPPPASSVSQPPSRPITPPRTPETSHFSYRSNSRSRNADVIEPFTDVTPDASPAPSSMHFPLDNKRRMDRLSYSTGSYERAPSITTQASSSQLTSTSSAGSNAPLLGNGSSTSSSRRISRNASSTGSQNSRRLTRAPTYTRHPLPSTPAVTELGYLYASSPLSQQQHLGTPVSQQQQQLEDLPPTPEYRSRPLPRHQHQGSGRTHMTVSELMQDDTSIIAGNTVDDLPPVYHSQPREEEISVAGGRLF